MSRVLQGECKLLRIFSDTSARWHGQPLGEALVQAARKAGLAGASLFDGIEGFRANGLLIEERTSVWSFNTPHECLVEIIDEKSRIDEFLKSSKEMLVKGAIITVERAYIPSLAETEK